MRDDVPAVSIVLPVFNRLDLLRATVDSVRAQTLQAWELVIADDGSDESPRSYLQQLGTDPRIRVLSGAHSGVPAAVRNAALAVARGRYVAFIDSDDLWLPDKLTRQLAAHGAHPQARWSYCDYLLVDGAGAVVPAARTLGCPQGWILEPLLDSAVDIWTPAVMVERALLERLGGFNAELLVFEDYDLWLRLATQSEAIFVAERLIAVRRHGQHFEPTAARGNMSESRHRSLRTLPPLAPNAAQRRAIERRLAGSALARAGTLLTSDRPQALRQAFALRDGAWRCRHWWRGLPRFLALWLVPRSLRELLRRLRPAQRRSP